MAGVRFLRKRPLPPLALKPSKYVARGRYFQSIELSEGEDVAMSVIDLLGEDILMYASDYPRFYRRYGSG